MPVSQIFTPEMWAELKELMTAQGWDVDATEQLWAADFSQRRIIADFMKDAGLGEKRLASMPDRVTNTINTLYAGKVHRPTVISCFDGDMSSMAAWWKEWRVFMFEKQVTVAGKKGATSITTPAAMLDVAGMRASCSRSPRSTACERPAMSWRLSPRGQTRRKRLILAGEKSSSSKEPTSGEADMRSRARRLHE